MIDQKLISEIYDKYSEELLIFITSFVHSPQVAEDILHDAFVKFIRYTINNTFHTQNIRAFFYKICRNLSLDYLKRNKKLSFSEIDQTAVFQNSDVDDQFEYNELVTGIKNFLNQQQPLLRSIYLLKSEQKLTYKEIAEKLGISERTAKRKMQTVLEKLAEELKKLGFLLFLLALLRLIIV